MKPKVVVAQTHVNPVIVDALEEMLAAAKSGQISELLTVYDSGSGNFRYKILGGPSRFKAAGYLAFLQQSVLADE